MATKKISKISKLKKINKKDLKAQSITIHQVITKTYSIANQALDKHATYYNDAGIVKNMQFASMTDPASIRPWQATFEVVSNLLHTLQTIPSIDIRLWVDGIEIVNEEEKNNFINDMQLTELTAINQSVLKPIPNGNLSKFKKEQMVKSQVSNWLRKMTGALPAMPMSECEKIQKTFI